MNGRDEPLSSPRIGAVFDLLRSGSLQESDLEADTIVDPGRRWRLH